MISLVEEGTESDLTVIIIKVVAFCVALAAHCRVIFHVGAMEFPVAQDGR